MHPIRIFLCLLLAWGLLFPFEAVAQSTLPTPRAQNAVFAAFGGAGVYTSLTYERKLWQREQFQAGAKAGVGFSPFRLTRGEDFMLPVGAFLLWGKGRHQADLSLSLTNYLSRQYDWESGESRGRYRALLAPALAYRNEKPEGGLAFKVGFSPLFNLASGLGAASTPWIELGLGWGF